MSPEKPQEWLSPKPKSNKEYAMDALSGIRSLADIVTINKAFPNMEKLASISNSPETFQKISDLTKICKWQNNAVDRKATQQYCEIMDPDESSFLS